MMAMISSELSREITMTVSDYLAVVGLGTLFFYLLGRLHDLLNK